MDSLALFVALFIFGSSLVLAEDSAPLMACTGSSDREMAPADRIKNFIDCLREQGHDEELLAELTRSFDGQGNAVAASSSCPPPTGDRSDEKGRFPYCSGMTDLQCRTLILVLESLLNVPASDGGGSPSGPREEDPLLDSVVDSPEDQRIQGALMKVILERFSDIVDEYRRWRIEHGGGNRTKRSVKTYSETGKEEEEEEKEEEEDVPRGIVNKSTSSEEVSPSAAVGHQARPRIASFRRPLTKRIRRQVPPGLPFKLPDRLTPEMQAVLDGYLAWREKNGYGKSTHRWG